MLTHKIIFFFHRMKQQRIRKKVHNFGEGWIVGWKEDGRKMEQRKRLILLIKISSIFPSSLNLRERSDFRIAHSTYPREFCSSA